MIVDISPQSGMRRQVNSIMVPPPARKSSGGSQPVPADIRTAPARQKCGSGPDVTRRDIRNPARFLLVRYQFDDAPRPPIDVQMHYS